MVRVKVMILEMYLLKVTVEYIWFCVVFIKGAEKKYM